jgi:hypothetical protein
MFKVNEKVKLLRESRGGALKAGEIGTVAEVRQTGNKNKDGIIVEFKVRITSDEEASQLGMEAFQTYRTLFPFETADKSLVKWDGKVAVQKPGLRNRLTNKEVYNILLNLLQQGKGHEPFTLNVEKK